MKIMKKLTALLLTVCLLIGMPMSIQASSSDPLTMTNVVILNDKQVVISFSEEVNLPSGNYFSGIGIYKGTANGLFRYKWNTAGDEPSAVANSGSTPEWTLSQWAVSNYQYYENDQTRLVGTISGDWNYSDIVKVYDKICKDLSGTPGRLVYKINDGNTSLSDHDGIEALTSKVGNKKLQSTHIDGLDWSQFTLNAGARLVGARLYASDHAVLQFSENMNAVNMCEVTYGLYKNGVLNEAAGLWTATSFNIFRNDKTKLVGYLKSSNGESLWEKSAQMTDHTIGVRIVSHLKNNNIIEEFTTVSGRALLATDSTVGDTAAINVSSRINEKLLTAERVFQVDDTHYVMEFSHDIDLPNAKYWMGIEIRNQSNQTTWYKDNGNGSYSVEYRSSSDRTGWTISQWGTREVKYYNGNKNQIVFTSASYADILKIYNSDPTDNRLVVRLAEAVDGNNTNTGTLLQVKGMDGTQLTCNFNGNETSVQPTITASPLLYGATLYAGGQLAVTFNQPMTNSLKNVELRLGLYKDGKLDATKASWTVNVNATNFYGTRNVILAPTNATQIADVLAANPGYKLGLTIVSGTAGADGTVSEIRNTASRGLTANAIIDGKDAVYTDVAFNTERLLTVLDVTPYKDQDLLITYSEDACRAANTSQYTAISLYKNGGMLRYRKNTATGEYEFATASQATAAGDAQGAWSHAQWVTTLKDYDYAGRRDQHLATLDNKWTYSQLMEFADMSGGELVFRMQESDSGVGYTGTLHSMVAVNDPNKKLLSTTFEANEQFRWVVYTPSEYVTVTSAVMTDAKTVKVVFSEEFPVDAFSVGTDRANILLCLASYANGEYKFTKTNGLYPQWGSLNKFSPLDEDGDGKTNTWMYNTNLSHVDMDFLDLLAMTQANGSPYNGYKVVLRFQEVNNNLANITGAHDAHLSCSGKYLPINGFNHGYYVEIDPGTLTLPGHVAMDGIEIVSEDEVNVKFTGEIVTNNAAAVLRILKADGTVAKNYPVKATLNGDSIAVRLDLANKVDNISNFSDLWKYYKNNYSDGSLIIGFEQLDGGVDGVISSIKTADGGHLLATVSNDAFKDIAYATIRESDFAWNTESFTIESVKQVSAESLIVKFTDDIELLGMDGAKKPWVGLRLVNEQGRLVRIVDGKPAVSGTGTYMQWSASSVEFNGEAKDELLITWKNKDIGLILSQSNMTLDLQQFDVAFSFEEAAVTEELGNHLIHNIVRAADGKQLDGSFYLSAAQADSRLVFGKDIQLIDPQAEVTIEGIEVIDQNRIVATFSEAVRLNATTGRGYISLVDPHFNVVYKDGKAMQWGGSLSYYDQAHTKVLFELNYKNNNPNHWNITGLDDIVNANLETDGNKLMFAIGDEKGNDGLIHSITSTTGKILAADPMNGGTDMVYVDFDASKVPQGELTITDAKIISDSQFILTFSAPVNIEENPYAALRWYAEDGRMVWKTKAGEYVFSSKHNGESTTPMQWGFKWEYYNKEQTQIIGTVNGGQKGLANFNDFIKKDWAAEVPGSSLVIGFEENNALAAEGTWHVENITLKSDPRISLSATLSRGNRDGAYTDFTVAYTPKPVNASFKLLNDMQILITYDQPVKMIGEPYTAMRFVNENGGLLYWGDSYNRLAMQFGGKLAFVEGSNTQMIWTMNGNQSFGVCNLSDLANYRNSLSMYKDAPVQFCIEEKTVKDVITIGGKNDLIDNIVTLDGSNHLAATKFGVSDGVWGDVDLSPLKGSDGVDILSVKAVDDQTVELTFSEAVKIDDPDNLSMVIRYLSPLGVSEVLVDGRNAQFKGDWEYKDDSKTVIVWKLNSRHAKSLTELFNYEGNFKWNEGARIAFCISSNTKGVPTKTMRIFGVTSLDGYRNLKAPFGELVEIQYDIEIAYDKPERVIETETEEEQVITKIVTNYTPFIIGGGVMLVACAATAIYLGKKKEGK
jgi:hypothetical protein